MTPFPPPDVATVPPLAFLAARALVAGIAALLALATISTPLALVIYFRLVPTLGSLGATAQSYLRVPISVGIGVLLGEQLSPTAWAGLACVVAGVIAMTLPSPTPHAIMHRPRT